MKKFVSLQTKLVRSRSSDSKLKVSLVTFRYSLSVFLVNASFSFEFSFLCVILSKVDFSLKYNPYCLFGAVEIYNFLGFEIFMD